jgi:Na+/H+ antiporter NhaD/arsenite permease-like protein
MLPAPVLAQHAATATASTTDPVSQLLVALIVVGVFVTLALEKAHRVLVVLVAVALLWAITYLTPYKLISFEASQAAIDLNVILLLAAMMAIVAVLKTTGVFSWAVARLLSRARGRVTLLMRLVTWFTGALSAFADNVTTVVFATPMAVRVAERTNLSPLALLLPMVMAANVGGTATLIGDPPNIMIGSGAGLDFLDFVANLTAPVLVMLVALEFFAERWFHHDLAAAAARAPAPLDGPEPVIQNPTLLRWSLAITLLVFIGFFTHGFTGMPASVPALLGAAALLLVQDILYVRDHRPSPEERVHGLLDVIEKEIEWPTLSFFAFLFIAVGAAVQTGLIDTIAGALSWGIREGSDALGLGPAGTLLFAAILLCWVSGALSGVIDNIPFVAVTIPVVARLTTELTGDTTVLWWALALGACLGGNGTVVGASANVTVVGLAERAGVRISFREFSRFGIPVTAMTLLIATAWLALHVYMGALGAFLVSIGTFVVLLVLRVIGGRATRRARPAEV